jgi:Ca2+-binding EF-hand superfamily protein
VRVDGKTLQEAHDDFMGHLFRHLDVKGKGYLGKDEIERAPLASHITSGGLGSFFGAYGMNMQGPAPAKLKGDKVTRADLAAYYRKHGLTPFQLQVEVESNNSGMMMVFGGGPSEPSVDAVSNAVFSLLDTDKTGQLTKKELAAAAEVLLRLDANEDEMITIRELVPATPPKAGAGMMKFGGSGFGLGAGKLAGTQNVFLIEPPGEAPWGLFTRMLERYNPKGAKPIDTLTRDALGLDEATFNALDANGDGVLDAKELAGFVKRAPDLEFVVHLGDAAGVELANKKGKPGILADKLKAFDGLALLDLLRTRVEFRAEGAAAADQFAALMRLQWTVIFKQADKDKNGYLDEQEAKNSAFASAFKAMDRDGDGKVTEQEFLAYLEFLEDLQARAKKACVALVLTDESRGLFDLLDVNRDGRLSVREMRAAPALLAKLDRQGKGFITAADLPRSYRLTVRSGPANAGGDDYGAVLTRVYGGGSKDQAYREPTKGPLWFRKMDKNRDGDVSRREWLGSEELFRQIDADNDGLISAEEADRFDAKSRKR